MQIKSICADSYDRSGPIRILTAERSSFLLLPWIRQRLLVYDWSAADEAAAGAANRVTLEQVRAEKQALKLMQRQMKELDALRRRHAKQRADVQRRQCVVFDKLMQLHERQRQRSDAGARKNRFVPGPILSVFPALIVHSELKSVHPGFPVAFIFKHKLINK